MASIEKLMKSLEALKVLQTSIDKPEEPLISAKFIKKEQASISKKEKISHCINIADIICSPQLRNIEDFQKFLGIAIEILLACCDDPDIGIRSNAGECLNRVIKSNLNTHLFRIQLEFYKELHKNGSSRSIKAALSRFAELAHLLRPAKCQPFLRELIKVLETISARTNEEAIQETISIAMSKMMPVFGRYASKDEIVRLLKCFLPNIGYSLAAVRRTAAISLAAICRYSKKPTYFYSLLIQNLLKSFHQGYSATSSHLSASQLQESSNNLLSGIFLCLKHLFPLIEDCPTDEESQGLAITPLQKQTFEKIIENLRDNLLQIYELIFHSLRFSNDNTVVLAALEALQQLKHPPKLILSNLLSINGLGQSRLSEKSILSSISSSPSLSVSQKRIRGYSSIASSCDNVNALGDDEDILIGSFSKATRLENDNSIELSSSVKSESSDAIRPSSSLSIASEPESTYDEGITKDYDERSAFRYSNKVLPMVMGSLDDENSRITDCPLSPTPSMPSFWDVETMPQINGIGEFCSEDTIPIEYCTRLLCARFLLNGTKGGLISDKAVRVSIKSLALNSLSSIMQLYPKAFLLDLQICPHPPDQSQKVWDISLYSSHPDPHLKSQISFVIANFVEHVLKLPMSYSEFISVNCAPTDILDAPSLAKLIINHIFPILTESSSTSSSLRNALLSLQICLPSLLKSEENVTSLFTKILNRLVSLKDHNYWLVKAGLLDLLSSLPYTHINYLEKNHAFKKPLLISSNVQDAIIEEIFLPFLSDEDFRVRASAASCSIKLVKNIFASNNQNNGDPVIASAQNLVESYLTPFASSRYYVSSVDETFPTSLLGPEFEFAVPFGAKKDNPCYDIHIESSLKIVVEKIINHLRSHSEHKYTLYGCLQALYELSEEFLVTIYPKAWNCGTEDNQFMTSLLEYLLYLLKNYPPLITDLTSHHAIISLVGNLLSGLAYQIVRQHVRDYTVLNIFECEWGYISKSSPNVERLYDQAAQHSIRLLSIFAVVYDETNFFQLSTYNQINSLSKPIISSLSPPALSPRRKKSFKQDNEKGESSRKSSEKEKNKHQKYLSFLSDPIMVKLFEIMKSTYASSKISMDLHDTKLTPLLKAILSLISQLLEIGGVKYFAKYSEEILVYLNIVFPQEPLHSAKCVHQLLKCLFSINFGNLFAIENVSTDEISGRDSSSLDQPMESSACSFPVPSVASGLYQTVVAIPYSNFSDYSIDGRSDLASFIRTTPNYEYWYCFLRKRIDKRITLILQEKSSYTELQSNQNAFKMSPASYIRLFETIVSKSLNLYPTTSNINLQSEILSITCLLVKLRIDYKLLDPEHIFLKFIYKQIEFIEHGYLGRCEYLIESIFNFFLSMTYSREQAGPIQSIITVPEIIPMCHNLMASDQPPTYFTLPALKKIVEDLMLCRVPSKVEPAKELDTQREVAIADLLKLTSHPESLQLLIMTIRQARKEGEDKWRKISRQIIDVVLPLITRQGVYINNYHDLEIVHQVCDSVSPAVFRPADYLLRALFTPPDSKFLQDYVIFQRWISSILIILRVLIMHTKEEIVIARLDDLLPSNSLNIQWMKDDSLLRGEFEDQFSPDLASATLLAEFLLNVVRICIETLVHYRESSSPVLRTQSILLVQQISCLLLYLTHMFQSGSYRRVAKRTSELLKEMISRNSVLGMINSSFTKLASHFPILMFQWYNILMLLGFDDHGTHRFWYKLIKGNDIGRTDLSPLAEAKEREKETNTDGQTANNTYLNAEMVRRAALILVCDFVCENMNDVEHLTWLIVNNIYDIIRWSYELPIRDFIHAVHRNQASSGLFIQAVAARCENFKEVAFLYRLLRCIELAHDTQSGSLITLIVDKILTNKQTQPFISIRLHAEKIGIRKLKFLLKTDNPEEAALQISLEDLERLLKSLESYSHRDLANLLKEYRSFISPAADPLFNSYLLIPHSPTNLNHPKDWFLNFFPSFCKHDHNWEELLQLFDKLSADELSILFGHKTWGLNILTKYIKVCCQENGEQTSVLKCNSGSIGEPIKRKARGSAMKICITSIEQHLSKIQSYLPFPHYSFSSMSEMFSVREIKHREQLIELFQQQFYRDYLHSFMSIYSSFILFVEKTKHYETSSETLTTLARISVLYAEIMFYDSESGNVDNLGSYISLLHTVCQCNSIIEIFSDSKSVSLFCSLISSVHSVVRSGETRSISLRKSLPEKEDLTKEQRSEYRHLIRACDRALELMRFLKLTGAWPTSRFPLSLHQRLRDIIVTLCRIPFINSLMMVPSSIWQLELWKPEFSGGYGTLCSTVPSDYIREKEILKQLIFSINSLGWIHRVQFEELWMSLLGVISPIQDGDAAMDDKLLVCTIAIDGITSLILFSLHEQAGNPIKPKTFHNPKRTIAFMHTKNGEKLTKILQYFNKASNDLELKTNSSVTLEKHFSVEYLRKRLGATTESSSLPSSESSSASSSAAQSPRATFNPNLSSSFGPKEGPQIDLGSCIHFLLELYGQLIGTHLTRSPLITEICKSLCFLSDLFFEKAQYEWFLNICLELFRLSVPNEDDMNIQYTAFGVAKSVAVLGIEQDQLLERCKKCITSSLNSPFLPTRINTLLGMWFLLEKRNTLPGGKEIMFLPPVTEYLLKHLNDSNLPSSHNEEHVLLMWEFSFHLMENFIDCLPEGVFPYRIFHASTKVLSSSACLNSKIYKTVSLGLERLLCCEIFMIADAESIIKVVMERLKPQKQCLTQEESFCLLRLMITCIYIYGPSTVTESRSTDSNEDFLFSMERVPAFFDRMKNCGKEEASVIASVIPSIMCDFLPPQEILNKIIGEFLGSQHILPQNLGFIVFKVFKILLRHSESSKIYDWILLSLSNFMQIQPIASATWCISCFLISASSNIWIRNLFYCLLSRVGFFQEKDQELFVTSCCSFYEELPKEAQKESFYEVFRAAAQPGNPYSRVFSNLELIKNGH